MLCLLLIGLSTVLMAKFDYAKIVPKDTLIYGSVGDLNQMLTNLKKLPAYQFKDHAAFKVLQKEFNTIIKSSGDHEIYIKLFKEMTTLFSDSFAVTARIKQVKGQHLPDLALFIKGENLEQRMVEMKGVLKKGIAEGKIVMHPGEVNGVKIVEVKGVDQKNPYYGLVFGQVGEHFILTTSQDYFGVLLRSIKNSALPKLTQNEIYRRYKKKHMNEDMGLFVNLREVIGYLKEQDKLKKQMGQMGQVIDLDALEGFYLTWRVGNDRAGHSKGYLIQNRDPSGLLSVVMNRKAAISEPAFIGAETYSFVGFHVDVAKIYGLIEKALDDKIKGSIKQSEVMMGLNFKDDIFGNLGPNFYLFSTAGKEEGERLVFAMDVQDFKPFLGVLEKFGPMFQNNLAITNYLDGKLITIRGEKLGIGLKNKRAILGMKTLVQENMQQMQKNERPFTGSELYQKLVSKKHTNQIMVSFVNSSMETYYQFLELDKELKTYAKQVKDPKQKLVMDAGRRVLDAFLKINAEEWRKYIGYTFSEAYIQGNDIIMDTSILP